MSSSSIHADPPPPIVTEPSGINYATGSALGKGGFAICHKAERYDGSRPTGQIVALKIVKTKMEPAKLAQKFVTELQIHSKLSHPNIVTFYRAFSFQTSTYVVLEICPNGSLADMLKKRRHLTLPEIRRLVIQVCGAVKYLHHRHIVHRDLKTGNLFLDKDMNVKVGDFGLAALLVTEKEMEVRRRTTMCGTPNYLAPEILEKGKGHDEKVDLWAIGVIAYTLAVGKAPFHASTKDEIYKKLKSGTYTWPELNATSNQSADLRDLVSSLLVPEEQRPIPDKIVTHQFFRIAYVPASIPVTAKEKTPVWPEVAVPSAETIRRGYSETWYSLCKESGVGEPEQDKPFPLNGGRRVRSIVYDMTKEAQQGRTPTMPIPSDVVYTSTVSDFNSSRSSSPEEPDLAQSTRGLKEISHNEVAASRGRLARTDSTKAAREAEMMPPPRAPSRVARSNTVRKAARTISEEAAKSSESVKVASDPAAAASSSQTLKVTRVRPAHTRTESASAATKALKETNASTTTTYRTARTEQPSSEGSDPEKPQRSGTVKRSADASLARRPRGTRTMKERPTSPVDVLAAPTQPIAARLAKDRAQSPPEVTGPLATLDDLKQALPTRHRKQPSKAEVIEILSDPEPEDKIETNNLHLSRPPPMAKRLPVPQKSVSPEINPAIPGSDPSTVLEKLTVLRDNLASALNKPTSTRRPSLQRDIEAASNLPFVSRWVDYSRKHGIGYVLSDGTVGCIINATSKPNQPPTPVSHVLVRNGQKWLQRVSTKSKDFAGIEQVPLEFFEDRGDEGIERKIYKGLGSVNGDSERKRTLSVLWVKFGRYMCQSLDGEENEGSTKGENFVRFYQRIGSVGVWAFADGCLQVHFPDHTKLVLSADGKIISSTLLTVEATQHLNSSGELLPQHVNSRQVFADSIESLLFSSNRIRQRTVKANQLSDKLKFVLEVVDQWVSGSGLGHLDEDEGAERLYWEGLCVRDQNQRKVDRVTVGRFGGDAVPSAAT
ncbi:Serine/threonine-protein kinase plo1 [Fulvia fulva]|uniref:Serine/threonine-protein kinase plo1 n=1 Tax=Passalora fulva TaxID=5499 RepID=A0A9Q8P747_PASFU|nr:Serine/threonine-protein kinase plo1 [Fulvia fulva]KAK4629278.1 Serine/threonine-protein kinase plo1 [Fulvia fulva]KAK4630704.1 Serine/threonine-protein kinase plo1 [Fulvia fulva]UJO15631.1 Serine/threonine-protein kinase plo1 [Fulvia fulva]WPV12325.1 Serine/threonine-protein kinase plo1 [Fulvia fulva]WPV27635.1 Serine/threonine-protein kinase plo1 [Fulvia fulva]